MLTTSRLGVALLLLAAPVSAQVLAARQESCAGLVLAQTSGDVDGDGLTDIVTSGFAMTVLLHDPAGGFTQHAGYSNVNVTGAIALGHLDGDGALDAVLNVASSGISRLLYRLGDGAGGFGPMVAIQLPAFPRGLAVGDLDGDGDDDVAVGAQFLNQVLILFSDGAGGLAPPVGVAAGGGPWDVQAGDLDDDGDLDLVTADSGSDSVSVLVNDGLAAFTLTSHPVPKEPLSVVIADVDEDDVPDLVVSADPTVLLLGNCTGGFAPYQPLSGSMNQLVFADVDGNGFGDLVGFGPIGLQVLFGADGPTFVAGPAGVPTGQFNDDVLLLDADLDGLPDFIACGGPQVAILRGQGFGTFESFGMSTCVGPPQAATTGDFDNDGDVDAALANAANIVGGGVVVLSNQHDGTLTQVSNIGMGKMYDIETGDVDSNGDLDLVSASKYMGLKLQLGDGSGTYGAATTVGGVDSADAALGDMDGDGDADIATCWGSGATARVGFFLSDGAGGFTGPKSKVIGSTPGRVKVSDLNVDGQLDLVALAQDARLALAVLIHGGALGEPIATSLVNYPWEMELGLIDADGWPDLVTLESISKTFEVRRGDGSGGFVPYASVPAGGAHSDLVVADMSGDDVPDLVSASNNPDSLVLAVNDGTGAFGESQQHVAGFAPLALTTGDLTSDGRRDALVVNYDGGIITTLEVLPNVGPDEPWTALGAGKMGTSGVPMLVGHGTLQPEAPLTLELRGAAPNSPATLVIGNSALFAPLKGGVLVPAPSFLLAGLVTNGQGELTLGADWPSDVPAGLQTWYQFWIADPAATAGFSASNGVTAVAP